jgi:hypothetical protein
MAVPTADDSARVAEEFADIVCSEPDWLDAEFEAIVAGFWNTPKTAAAPLWAPDDFIAVSGSDTVQTLAPRNDPASSAGSPIRSPPTPAPGFAR